MKRVVSLIFLAAGLCISWEAAAQKYPERREIRSGNRQFEAGEFTEAETAYRRALELYPQSLEAAFNLSDALYKQERYEEAAQVAGYLAQDSTRHSDLQAKAFYNQGNAYFQQRKFQEALEAYKSSLRLNPDDQEAKFNLAYTRKMLEKDQDDNQNDDQNQDQDQDQNQDQNNDDNQDQNDNQNDPNQNNNDQNQDNDPNSDQNQPPPGEGQQPPPQQSGMSREEADRMLDAIQGSEDNTKEKMEGEKASLAAPSGKNW